jgi:hypothetical protein
MNADQRAVAGEGNITDYDALTGGVLSAYMDPYTAGDEGTLVNTGKPGTASSSYTPPAWLTTRNNASGNQLTAAQNLAPVLNDQPASGPGFINQPTKKKK